MGAGAAGVPAAISAKGADGSIQFNAKKGVILAAGDYQNDDEMMDYYLPDLHYLGRKQNNKTGDGALHRPKKLGRNFYDPSKPLVVYLEQMFVVATLGFIHIQVGLVQYC